MALETRLYDALSGAAGLAAVGIYPLVKLQNVTTPVIVYDRISGRNIVHLQGRGNVTLENARIQFDIYSTAVDTQRTVCAALITALDDATAFSAIPGFSPIDDYDPTVGIYRRILDVSIWNRG